MKTYEIAITVLADWLQAQGPGRWWNVDDEGRLSSVLELPCTGEDLAEELRRIGGNVCVVAPKDQALPVGQSLSLDEISKIAKAGGADPMLQLSWPGAEQGDIWVLSEDTFAAKTVGLSVSIK